jgi:hypothetical protein
MRMSLPKGGRPSLDVTVEVSCCVPWLVSGPRKKPTKSYLRTPHVFLSVSLPDQREDANQVPPEG